MSILVVCAGAHATDIAAWSPEPIIGFLDDAESGPNILGPTTLVDLFPHDWICGHNDLIVRKRIAENTKKPATVLLSDKAQIDPSVVSAEGVFVGPNSTIGPKVFLGRHTHVNANVFITRAFLGDYCTISPGAVICGDVQIGNNVSIGAGAVISNLVMIGSNVVIGAGTVIPPGKQIPANSTWVGVPGRQIK